jgi:phospholipase/carboxylesterase
MQLHYLVQEPAIIKESNPLIILLHGYGSNEEDLFSFASELSNENFIISVRAPYDLKPYGHAWYAIHFDADENKFSDNEEAIKSRDLIVRFIDEAIQKFPIDAQNVTLIGFSQGTILSTAVALSYPEKVKNVVALSGYLNEEILKDNFQENNFKNLNFFVSHGTVDQVIPISWAQKTQPFLEKLGINFVYKEYPVGHGVAPQNFYDFKKWLESIK